jgi:hypothetical protein
VAGEKARFKLRVRTYSDDPSSPAFFEVKEKTNKVVSKRRAGSVGNNKKYARKCYVAALFGSIMT